MAKVAAHVQKAHQVHTVTDTLATSLRRCVQAT